MNTYKVQKSTYVGDTGNETWQRWCVVGPQCFLGWYDSQPIAQEVADRLNNDSENH